MAMVTDQLGRTVTIPARAERIISLVPSQTELLHDLGLHERVVGITKFCVHPEAWYRTKTRIGGTKKLDLEAIGELQPDLIIGNKEENDEAQIRQLMLHHPVWMSDVRDLDGALDMIQRLGAVLDEHGTALAISKKIRSKFDQLQPIAPALRTMYLIWKEPWMAVGGDTFINDMLQRNGFQNSMGTAEGRYPEVTTETIKVIDPEVILLSSEPFPFKEEHRKELSSILPKARIHYVDGELFSWYGSRLLRTPAYLEKLQIALKPSRSTPSG